MKRLWQCSILALGAVVCYLNTLFGTFVFDDSEAVVKNKDVLPATPIQEVFKNDFWGTDVTLNLSHKSYRPLTILSYRFNLLLTDSKLNATHFHGTNITLYALLCILTVPVLQIFTKRRKHQAEDDTVFLSSLLFTVHPIHTEVVASIVGRADILCSILFLVSILLYHKAIKSRCPLYFSFTIFIIIAATLCKEIAITALAVCYMYDCLSNNSLKHGLSKTILYQKDLILRGAVLCLAGCVLLYLRLKVMNFEGPIFASVDNPAAFSTDLFTRVFTYNYVYFLNFLLLLWPQWLCFDWSMGCIPLIKDFCDIRIIIVIIFWCVTILCIFQFLKSLPSYKIHRSFPCLMGFSVILFPFLPASNLFLKVGFVIAERTLLLPSLGFCFFVVIGFKRLTTTFKESTFILYSCFYTICVVFAIRSIQRNADWLSEENLFMSALSVCPLNAKVHYNVAKVAADNNNNLLAKSEYRRAIELNSEYEQPMNNLANLLRDEKQFDEAQALLERAVQIRPNFAAAWMNLGIVFTNLNRLEEAEDCYITAISHRKKYPDCYYNLGNLYLDLKRNEEALKAWEKAVSFRHTHTAAWSNMLVLLDTLKRFDEVIDIGRTALMYNPTSPALHFSIANTLGKLQEFDKAEKHFLEALNLNPKNALYYSNLGVLYHRWQKPERAREMYKKALQLDPTMETAKSNLRKLN